MGLIIGVSPGHVGNSWGANPFKRNEEGPNTAIALTIYNKLMAIPGTLVTPLYITGSWKERANNYNDCDFSIEIHCDSLLMHPNMNGFHLIKKENDSMASLFTLALHKKLIKKFEKRRFPHNENMRIFRITTKPVVLLEVDFLTGDIGKLRLFSPKFINEFSEETVAGILEFTQTYDRF